MRTDRKEPEAPGRGQRGLEIIPMLSVRETYTDNVRLRPSGSEQGDWVTEVRPGVSVTGRGARLRFNATYSAGLVHRAQEGSNDVFHHLNAKGDAELVQQLLFIDARANVSQQNLSLLGPQAGSNVNETENRATVRTFSVSPYLRHNFGREAQGEARVTYSIVNTGNASGSTNASTFNSEADRIDLRLASGPAYKLLTWNVAYNREHIDYTETHQRVVIEKISAGGKRLITPVLGLQATVGYEDNDYGISGPSSKGKFWNLGPEWTPTPRTRLAANMGRRHFGPAHSLDFSHRTRLTTWRLEYSKDVTTNRAQLTIPTSVDTAGYLDTLFLSRIPDELARQAAVQEFISRTGLPPTLEVPLNFFTNTPFVVTRMRASFGIHGTRNTVLANAFMEDREAASFGPTGAGDFSQTRDVRQTGASLIWTLRITGQTTSNASAGHTRSEFSSLAREDKLSYVRLGITKQFQPKLSGTVDLRRLKNESNQAGSGYTENAVSAALRMRF